MLMHQRTQSLLNSVGEYIVDGEIHSNVLIPPIAPFISEIFLSTIKSFSHQYGSNFSEHEDWKISDYHR